jgi:hypothetical protein
MRCIAIVDSSLSDLRAKNQAQNEGAALEMEIFARSYASQATGRMRDCKVFSANRSKVFHVKHFCPIEGLDRSKRAPHFRACVALSRVAGRSMPVMGIVAMPVPLEAPTRGNGRPRRVANNAARHQADRTADQGTRQRTHRAVAQPFLCFCKGRQKK